MLLIHQGHQSYQTRFLPSKTALNRQQQLLLLLPREYSLPAASRLGLINCFVLSVSYCFVSSLAIPTLTLVFVVACDRGIVHIIEHFIYFDGSKKEVNEVVRLNSIILLNRQGSLGACSLNFSQKVVIEALVSCTGCIYIVL